MVKRFAQLSLAVFLVLALAGMASAGLKDLPNTTQKGSLLVFPKVANWDNKVVTYFFIGNDFADNVWIKCYWMDENQTIKDFLFPVTANQPIYFASNENDYGPPFNDNTAGSLVCWAQEARDTAPRLSYNHLYGYAMITDGANNNVFYNAYSFKIVDPTKAFTTIPDAQGGGGRLNLDGAGYDNCHKYLVTNFIPAGASFGPVEGDVDEPAGVQPELTLWPCKQDLRQDREPTCTKAKFDVWNWNERKYTGAYQCFKCFFEGYLHVIGAKNDTEFWGGRVFKRGPGANGAHFTAKSLRDNIARMRVQGVKSDPVCTPKLTGAQGVWCSTTVNTGLLGVMLYGAPGSLPGSITPVAGHTLHGAGQHQDASWIKFDTEDSAIYESPVR